MVRVLWPQTLDEQMSFYHIQINRFSDRAMSLSGLMEENLDIQHKWDLQISLNICKSLGGYVIRSGKPWHQLCWHSPVSLAVSRDSEPDSWRAATEEPCTVPHTAWTVPLLHTRTIIRWQTPTCPLPIVPLGRCHPISAPCSAPDTGQSANSSLNCRLLFFANVVTTFFSFLPFSLICLVFLSIQVRAQSKIK